MIKSILIKFGAVGFSSLVVYGTYSFIQKNEKIFNLLTGNNKLKNIRSDIDHKNINNPISYQLKNAIDISDNLQTQKLLEIKEISNSSTISEQETPINTANSTSNGIDITAEKSEIKITSISDNVTFNKSQIPINKTNNTSSGINVITKTSETKTTSISNSVSINKPQFPKKRRLSQKERSRKYGPWSSLN